MKARKSKKNLRKGKKLEPTKALKVAHSDFTFTRPVNVSSPIVH